MNSFDVQREPVMVRHLVRFTNPIAFFFGSGLSTQGDLLHRAKSPGASSPC